MFIRIENCSEVSAFCAASDWRRRSWAFWPSTPAQPASSTAVATRRRAAKNAPHTAVIDARPGPGAPPSE